MIRTALERYRNVWIGALTLLGAFYLASASEPKETGPEGPDVKRVKVAAVEAAEDHQDLRFSGVTRAARRSRLAFTVDGRVVSRPVEVGDRVRKGQEIARLSDRERRNAVASSEGAVAELRARRGQSERDLARVEQLLDAKAATVEEVERVRAGLDALRAAETAAEARAKESRRRLAETTLRAPFAGTITEVFPEPGEYAGPGSPIVVLSGDGELELAIEVPESVVPRIRQGDSVKVHIPYLGREIEGRVHSVGRAAPGPGQLFPVHVRLPESPGLVAGTTAELRISLISDSALTVPVEAVVDPGGRRPSVYRLRATDSGSYVERVFLEVGSLLGNRVVARGGLEAGGLEVGDLVVVGGQRGLLDGETVEVVETPR